MSKRPRNTALPSSDINQSGDEAALFKELALILSAPGAPDNRKASRLLAQIIARYEKTLGSLLRVSGTSHHDIEDLLSELWARLVSDAAIVDKLCTMPRAARISYLAAILRRRGIDEHRRIYGRERTLANEHGRTGSGRRSFQPLESLEDGPVPSVIRVEASDDTHPNGEVDHRQVTYLLRALSPCLKTHCNTAWKTEMFLRRALFDEDWKDIAGDMGRDEKNLRVAYGAMLRRFRECPHQDGCWIAQVGTKKAE